MLSTTTTTFSTFSLHLTLPPIHPTPTAPNSFCLFNAHKQYKFPHLPIPALHHFVRAPLSSPSQPFIISFVRLPTSDSNSRMGPQFGRSQEETAFLWGRQELLQSPTSWTSDDESALAFHGSIFDPRGETFSCLS